MSWDHWPCEFVVFPLPILKKCMNCVERLYVHASHFDKDGHIGTWPTHINQISILMINVCNFLFIGHDCQIISS